MPMIKICKKGFSQEELVVLERAMWRAYDYIFDQYCTNKKFTCVDASQKPSCPIYNLCHSMQSTCNWLHDLNQMDVNNSSVN